MNPLRRRAPKKTDLADDAVGELCLLSALSKFVQGWNLAGFSPSSFEITESHVVVFTCLDSVSTVKFIDSRSWNQDCDGDSSVAMGWQVQQTGGVGDVIANQITPTRFHLHRHPWLAGISRLHAEVSKIEN